MDFGFAVFHQTYSEYIKTNIFYKHITVNFQKQINATLKLIYQYIFSYEPDLDSRSLKRKNRLHHQTFNCVDELQ